MCLSTLDAEDFSYVEVGIADDEDKELRQDYLEMCENMLTQINCSFEKLFGQTNFVKRFICIFKSF